MRYLSLSLALCLTAPAARAQAPMPPAGSTIAQSLKSLYEQEKKFLLATAEKVPADQYAYRPTPEVRSIGQLIGHLADSQFSYCSVARKEKDPDRKIEKNVTAKAELQKALAESFAYCDAAYAAATDASLSQMVDMGDGKVPAFEPLARNATHDNEHYGNLVTYMRLKGIVPPSSVRTAS